MNAIGGGVIELLTKKKARSKSAWKASGHIDYPSRFENRIMEEN